MGGALRGRVKKMKGLRSTIGSYKITTGDVKYSIGNIVNNVITVYGIR